METVSFDLAKKLKEKGYPQHWSNDDYIVENEYEDNFEVGCYYDRCLIPEHIATIAAPTISQVLKWLREECGIFILIEPDLLSPKYELTFTIRVKFYIKGEEDEGFSEKYLTYRRKSWEDLALTGIEYVLDNLI